MPARTDVRDPAPPKAPAGGGGGGRWSRVVTARDAIEAELVRGVLEGAGVPVVLDHRDDSPFAWMYPGGNLNAPVAVLVPSPLLESARLSLMEANLLGPDLPAGSPADAPVGVPSGVVRWIVGVLVLLVLGGFVVFELLGDALRSLLR